MKINIRDHQVMKTISPTTAALYLQARGWQLLKEEPGRASTRTLTLANEGYEVLNALS